MKKNETNFEKAYFVKRLAAYIIDIMIVMFISSLLTIPFNSESVNKLSQQTVDVTNEYLNKGIDTSTYMNQSIDLSYQLSKLTGLSTVITIIIYVLYFIVFQYYMSGQTIGKRILNIRIEKNDNSDLTMNDIVIRNLINNSILCNIVVVILVLISKNVYFYGSSIIQMVQYMLIVVNVVNVFMIIIRKDGRSISDLIANTKVVNMKEK